MEKIVKLRTNRDCYDIREASKFSISVQDVIDILERCPRDAKIVFSNDNDYTFGELCYSSIRMTEVETFEEEAERERKERELEEDALYLCPHCDSEDFIVGNKGKGHWYCCNCGKYFNEQKIVQLTNQLN